MFERFYRLFSCGIGIDLGTANTLVYLKGTGIVINEPSIVAVNEKTGRLVAVGNDAKQMVGRTPLHLSIVKPLVEGVISNFEVAEEMLAYFIRRVREITMRRFLRPTVVIGVPSGITNVEIRAVRDAAKNAGARLVYIIEESMATALGIRLPVYEPVGHMLIDIGGGTTDIAVISLGGIVRSKNLKIAGERFNSDIIAYVRDEFKVLVGEKTAEDIKIKIGSVIKQKEPREATVRGRDLITGLPKEVVLTDSDIREALGGSLEIFVDAVKEVLESTPPEVISDIMHQGIIITGGSALMTGLDELLTHELKIQVTLADDPLTAIVRGTGIVLEEIERYRDLLISDKDDLPPR